MAAFATDDWIDAPPEAVTDLVTDLSQWSTFRGAGPIPGIVRAEADGPVAAGARIRVTNTDGSVHHEVIEALERGRRLEIRMELGPPAAHVLAGIVERLELSPVYGGTRVRRSFELRPRSMWTAPLAWAMSLFLRRAVRAHNAVMAATLGAR